MWKDYEVKIQFTGRLAAGMPRDPKSIIALMELKGRADLIPEVAAEVEASPAEEGASRLVFKRNESGLYLEGYTWKAHLKNSANVLAGMVKKGGLAAFRSKLADRVYVIEEHMPLLRGGEPIHEADDEFIHPIQVMTMQGPRTSVKVNEIVTKASCGFTLKLLEDGIISEQMLRDCFTYGALHGYGGERGLGFGRYEWELEVKK